MAERVGFEPTVPFGITGFQDQLLKPLGHLSKKLGQATEIMIPQFPSLVKNFYGRFFVFAKFMYGKLEMQVIGVSIRIIGRINQSDNQHKNQQNDAKNQCDNRHN